MRWIVGIAVVLATTLASPARALADGPSYYPPVLWLPAAEGNFTVGRGGEHVTTIVIHQTEGSYRSALSWFRRPGSMASAHYLIRSSAGTAGQPSPPDGGSAQSAPPPASFSDDPRVVATALQVLTAIDTVQYARLPQ